MPEDKGGSMTNGNPSLSVRLALVYAAATLLFLLVLLAAQRAKAADAGDTLGEHMYTRVQKGETLYDIAQKYDVGIGEIRAANPTVSDATLKAGRVLVLPTSHLLPDVEHNGIVINLPERRLYYFDDPSGPMTFPVTVGKEGWETPMGVTYIANKRTDPTWTVPDKIRAEDPDLPAVVPPGPDNPLGKYAMDLGFNGIRIHGTNNPRSIGKQSSHGCIRMYPADIENLFNRVPLKTKVTIINQPYKIGWLNDTLYLEVAPPAAGTVARSVSVADVKSTLESKVDGMALVDWDTVEVSVKRRDGMPVAIGRRAGPATAPAIAAAPYYQPDATISVSHTGEAAGNRAAPGYGRPAFTPYTSRSYRPVAPPAAYGYHDAPPSTDEDEHTSYYENADGAPIPPLE
jgi:L,D-transpeptidase ErfK/SrfK